MHIDKLTILTRGLPKVVLKKPDPKLAEEQLLEAVLRQCKRFNSEQLPNKIKNKIADEKHVPSFINRDCLVCNTAINEDLRVLGAKTLNYLSWKKQRRNYMKANIIITKLQDGAGGLYRLSRPVVYENPSQKNAAKILKNAVLDKNIYGLNDILPKRTLNTDVFSSQVPEYLRPNKITNNVNNPY